MTAVPAPAPERDPAADRRRRRRIARSAGGLAVLVAVVAFVVENSRSVRVKFWFFTAHPRLIWVVVVSLAVGALFGYVVGHPGRRRRRKEGRRRGLFGGRHAESEA